MRNVPLPTMAKSFWQAVMNPLRASFGLRCESMKSSTSFRPAMPPVALMYLTAAGDAVDAALEEPGRERVVDVGDRRDVDLLRRHTDLGRLGLGVGGAAGGRHQRDPDREHGQRDQRAGGAGRVGVGSQGSPSGSKTAKMSDISALVKMSDLLVAIVCGRRWRWSVASLGVAVVGRRFGARVQVPALRSAGFEVVALVGRDREPTAYKATKLGIPNACGSLAEALALPGVDAVAIATPPDTHFGLALEAVESGRHVLCEKPFTTDAAQAAELVTAVDRAGVVGALGHEFRWNPARAAVGAAIASGAIGSPRLATVVEYTPFLRPTDSAMAMPAWFEEPGIGGWLGANGSHTLDQLRLWLGPYRSVSATMVVASEQDRTVEDSYSARFDMGTGVEAVLQNVGAAWTARGFVAVTGTRGTVGIDDGQAWIADTDGTRPLAHRRARRRSGPGPSPTTISTCSAGTSSVTTSSWPGRSWRPSRARRSHHPCRCRRSRTVWR